MAEVDPVSDFLSREQEDLAGLGEDFANPPSEQNAKPETVASDIDAPISLDGNQDQFGDGFGGGSDSFGAGTDGFGAGNDDLGDLTSATDDLNGGFGITNGHTEDPLAPEVSEPYEPAPLPSMPRVEPEKIKVWREEQKDRLEKKDAAEEIAKAKMRADAKKELEEWNRNRLEQLEKTCKQNRVAEAELIRVRDTALPGQEWERITSLCEFNPKGAKNSKDVTRLRSILLQLKQVKGEE